MKKYELRYELYGMSYISHAKYPKLRHLSRHWTISVRVADVNSGKILIDYNSLEYVTKPNKRDLRKLRALIMWEVKNFIRNGLPFPGAYDDIR